MLVRTALVIDPDPQSAKLVAVVLESEGWQVQVPATFVDAERALLTGARPDVILIELMPLTSGLAFVETIKRRPATKSIPIVAVSSFNGDDVQRVIVEAGCSGYFRKPIDVTTFAADLDLMLGGKP